MLSLSPDDFEEFVAEVWEARGFETRVTQSSKDAGKDVIAKKNGKRVAIQAKRYQPSNRVTSPEIQQYGSLLHDEAIDEVVIVTSSTFTNDAYRRAQEIGLDLIDGERLLTFGDKYQPSSNGSSGDRDTDSSKESKESIGATVNLLALPFKIIIAYFAIMTKFIIWYFKLMIGIILWPIKVLSDSSEE